MSPSCFPEYPRYFRYAHFISFNSVFADREAIADGLNPLTISHTARTISCTPIGSCTKMKGVEKYIIWPDIANKAPANDNAAPIKPQPDSHRGMSFD